MKKKINVFEYSNEIMKALQTGVLLSTNVDGKQNAMTISWGSFGVDWGKPIFTTFVRESRFTLEQLEKNPFFTINVPLGDCDKKILSVCGTKSGRDMDKIQATGLTLVPAEVNGVGGYKELPLTIECRVVYKQAQDTDQLNSGDLAKWYPKDDNGKGDYHIAFVGEVVSAYIIQE